MPDYFEFVPSAEDQAKEQVAIEEWQRQVSAEVMQTLALQKRDEVEKRDISIRMIFRTIWKWLYLIIILGGSGGMTGSGVTMRRLGLAMVAMGDISAGEGESDFFEAYGKAPVAIGDDAVVF